MDAPSSITVKPKDRAIEVAWAGGAAFALPFEYLRVFSPSAEVRGHGLQTAAGAHEEFDKLAIDGAQARQTRNGNLPLDRHAATLAAQPFDDHRPLAVGTG